MHSDTKESFPGIDLDRMDKTKIAAIRYDAEQFLASLPEA